MTELMWTVLLGASLSGLWWLFAFEYRSYRVDLLRQRLFSIRDDLFKRAYDQNIPFETRAYLITRTTLNGMIRFAHTLNFLRVLASAMAHSFDKNNPVVANHYRQVRESLNEIDDETRDLITETRMNMHVAIFDHIVHTSLVLFLLVRIPIGIVGLVYRGLTVTNRISDKRWAFLDAEANGEGGGNSLTRSAAA